MTGYIVIHELGIGPRAMRQSASSDQMGGMPIRGVLFAAGRSAATLFRTRARAVAALRRARQFWKAYGGRDDAAKWHVVRVSTRTDRYRRSS